MSFSFTTAKLLPNVNCRFMPFGAGTRVCLGEGLAKNRLFLAVVATVQRIELQPPQNGKLQTCDPRDYKFGGILYPRPYKLRMVPRYDTPDNNKKS